MRFLYKCRITAFGDSYNLNCEGNGKTITKVFRGSEEAFLKFLRKIKASDVKTIPKSMKNSTYKAMIDHGYFYVWSNNIPKDITISESISFLESEKLAQEWIDES